VGGRWDTSANDNVLAYASKLGESSASLNLQLEFIWYELTTFGYGFTQLKATTNVTDATVVFMDKYEICGTCAQSQRVSYANAVLAAYGATPDYSASYVSQSWPLASQPAFTVKCGQRVAAKIVLKNSGGKHWDSSTRLGTTQPRDRASIFGGADWISPNRAATSGSVAPGGDGTFAFSFDGPTGAACKPGTYHEYFGVVEEGVAWFSDSGQGGPPDNQIEALIDLVPGDPEPPDLAQPPTRVDLGSDDGGEAPAVSDDGGLGRSTETPGSTSGAPTSSEPTPSSGVQGGCSAAGGGDVSLAALLLVGLFAIRRRW
jgi:MYXO-CTERM domain-containing protein